MTGLLATALAAGALLFVSSPTTRVSGFGPPLSGMEHVCTPSLPSSSPVPVPVATAPVAVGAAAALASSSEGETVTTAADERGAAAAASADNASSVLPTPIVSTQARRLERRRRRRRLKDRAAGPCLRSSYEAGGHDGSSPPSFEQQEEEAVDDALLPHLQPGPVRDALESEGYAVIPRVCTPEECDAAVSLIWNLIEDVTSGQVSRNDPATWWNDAATHGGAGAITELHDGPNTDDADPWPHTGYKSFPDMFQSLGAGWVLADAKQRVCDRVFAPLFGTAELHCSKEGFSFVRPPPRNDGSSRPAANPVMVCGKLQHLSTGEHYDQASARVGLHGIQSLLALEDQEDGVDGSFLCYPRSFGTVHQQITAGTYRGAAGTWFPLTDAEIERIQAEFGCAPRRLYLSKGDVLLWRSDLVHAPQMPKPAPSGGSTSRRFRAVSYCSALPAHMTPPHVLPKKLAAYRERRTGDHRAAEESWHSHRRRQQTPTVIGESQHRPHYRYSPPLVTVRQAQLFGLVPYPSQSTEACYERELQLAEIRGVRFRLDDNNDEGDSTSRDLPIPAGAVAARSTVVPSIGPIVKCDARLEHLTLDDGTSADSVHTWRRHPMQGSDKYLGGMASPCGNYVYGVPGGARRVLRIDVQSGAMDMIGPSYEGKFKWLRGVTVPASAVTANRDKYPLGCCVALPSNAPSVLKVNPATHNVYAFGESVLKGCGDDCWLYHGGNLADNGYVYAIPANAHRVCKFHPTTDEIKLIGPTFEGKQKWYGGIVGSDRCIYGIPHNAQGVLKIDPATDEVTVLYQHDGQPLKEGLWKWHGGARAGDKIIGFPNNADDVLVINTAQQRVYTVGDATVLQSGRHRADNRYKYLGGAVDRDGRYLYLFPCDAERVLRFDCEADEIELIGPLLLDGENKFQNGFCARDGCLYGIPQRATGVLRIIPHSVQPDLAEDHVDIMDCGEDLVGVKDKFEGGVMGGDDCIYCIPLRSRTAVKIIPGPSVNDRRTA